MTTENENPLCPELTEQGKEEAQKIMDSFKPKIQALVAEILSDLYTDVSYYVDSDHWQNYRTTIMNGLKNYTYGKKCNAYDYEELRKAIYKNNKDEIVKDLNQDLVIENKMLEGDVARLRQELYKLYDRQNMR